ncbi:hypothetical protein HPP92_010265 [Vanilla planifolia]|uniref:Uncharacterized protein n=1 Tax=Vanilla planifolia TaxID=51239 RepID=A0A835UZ41_VANPL|nr:hypothetical protein HPP92_010265 [Vanilla planifolia]
MEELNKDEEPEEESRRGIGGGIRRGIGGEIEEEFEKSRREFEKLKEEEFEELKKESEEELEGIGRELEKLRRGEECGIGGIKGVEEFKEELE